MGIAVLILLLSDDTSCQYVHGWNPIFDSSPLLRYPSFPQQEWIFLCCQSGINQNLRKPGFHSKKAALDIHPSDDPRLFGPKSSPHQFHHRTIPVTRLTCEQSHKQQHQPQEGQEGGLNGDWGRSPENMAWNVRFGCDKVRIWENKVWSLNLG